VLKKYVHQHPYKTPVHELKERDSVKRVEYCPWFRDEITTSEEDILDVLFFFTDGAWFHLSSYVNSQHSRTWSITRMRSRIHHCIIRRFVCIVFFLIVLVGVESNCVHSALRPLIGLLCQPRVIMMMEKLVE
jgi:hypothetical protein